VRASRLLMAVRNTGLHLKFFRKYPA